MLDQQRNELTNVIARKSEEEKEQEKHQQTSLVTINHGALYDNLNDVDNYWSLYIYAMKSPVTREKYVKRLDKFLDFIGLEGLSVKEKSAAFLQIARQNPQQAFNNIIKFLQFQNQRVNAKEITGATVRNYVKSIKLFCEMAVLPIAWKKITRGLPRGRKYADDRIPTIQELRRLIAYPDRRIKAIVYTMVSSGIRLGSWDYLRWGHLRPVEKDGKLVAARMIVYAGEDDEYFSYISVEAFQEIKEWMVYRQQSGESISEDSWVMRDLWDTRKPQGRGLSTRPKKLCSLGVKRLMERAHWAQGLRNKLENGKKRHPYQANHSLRKWFKTRCEIGGMKPINVETLLSHSTGISNSYYRPTENDLLEDYLRVVDHLTIDDRHVLQRQVQDMAEKTENSDLVIESRFQQKDLELLEWKKKYLKDVKGLIQQMDAMREFRKETQKELAELKRQRLRHMNLAFST